LAKYPFWLKNRISSECGLIELMTVESLTQPADSGIVILGVQCRFSVFENMYPKALMTLLTGIVAFVALVIAIVVILKIRRKFLKSSHQGSASPFTLDGIQKLHDNGQISEQEYKRLRNKIIQDMQE
jgi:uncharacterized membrane protein